jgi:hydroxyacylglutathione hydrolase
MSSPIHTHPVFNGGKVHFFTMFQDNFGYLITDGKSNRAATVDPGDGEAVLDWAQQLGLELTTVICTHKHSDHVGGNLYLKSAIPSLEIIGPKYEEIPGLTRAVEDGETFTFESLKFNTLYVPCHTAGHVAYFVEELGHEGKQPGVLFSGDTLFVGGCGRFFEGTPEEMQANMERLSTLPPETLVFCAHEYTQSNYRFLAHIDEESCGEKYEEIVSLRSRNLPTVPSTIDSEMRFNLFMKCHDPKLQSILGTSTAVDTMRQLRELKNQFR